ncbi:hypothetical protein pb186bvf_009893 [Paramecium bursaria]
MNKNLIRFECDACVRNIPVKGTKTQMQEVLLSLYDQQKKLQNPSQFATLLSLKIRSGTVLNALSVKTDILEAISVRRDELSYNHLNQSFKFYTQNTLIYKFFSSNTICLVMQAFYQIQLYDLIMICVFYFYPNDNIICQQSFFLSRF